MRAVAKLGRPRSEHARSAALAAAVALVERDGYPAVTVKGIAEAAGIGRQTVYRWWPTKADVLLEAVIEISAEHAEPDPTGDAVADLRTMLRATFALTGRAGPVIAGLMAEATHDRAFAERLQERLLARRRAVLRAILAAGQHAGQLGHGIPLDLAVDLVFGTMWYRVLSGHAPVDQHLADQLSTTVSTLLGPP
jgi:AcrR family transcriptional regulator